MKQTLVRTLAVYFLTITLAIISAKSTFAETTLVANADTVISTQPINKDTTKISKTETQLLKEDKTAINWFQVLIGFLSGGAFGALLKQFFESRKNRIQPIGRAVELKSFYDSNDNKIINTQIILTGATQEHKFSKLYTGTIKVANSGSNDYSSFTFGVTCPEDVKFIHIKPVFNDRHHIPEITEVPSLEKQVNYFDINLKPFNRKDTYSFDVILTTISPREITKDDIQLSTSQPIKWIDAIPTSRLLLEFADAIIKVGPISLSIDRGK